MVKKIAQTKAKPGINGDEKFLAALTGKNAKNAKIGKPAKKQQKAPVKAVPPKKVIEEEEESDEEVESDSGADLQAEHDSEENEEEQEVEESDEEEEDDDDDEDEDEEGVEDEDEETGLKAEEEDEEDEDEEEDDEDEAEDSDDGAPTEKRIGKTDKSKGPLPKIKSGNIPITTPNEQVIYVKGLPNKLKQSEIVEVFSKYGNIDTIKLFRKDAENSSAFVAFDTAKSAKAALGADGKAKIQGSTLEVSLRRPTAQQKLQEEKSRTVFIKNVKVGTTEEQLREHFISCGEIKKVHVVSRKTNAYGFVVFAEESTLDAAKKLHNTVLNGVTINVFRNDEHGSSSKTVKDAKHTILIKNTSQLDSIPEDKIKKIFAKCGPIDFVDILCKKNVLAFVTFKDESSVAKAFKLNGSTVEGLEVSIEKYGPVAEKPKTTIFVQNVKPGVTEEELRGLFTKSGDIESVFVKSGFAIIKFQEPEGFCKSFLLNESLLQGQMIFIEPYSDKKQAALKKQKFHQKKPLQQNRKRPSPNAKFGNAKKFKSN